MLSHKSNNKPTNKTDKPLPVGVKAVLDQALQSYERLPMLEIVFEKFSQHLATSLRQLTSEPIDVDIDSFESLRFSEYFKHLTSPTPITVFKAIEWENFGLLILDYNFISSFIDVLFGGKKNINNQMKRDTSRGLTAIEQGITKQISEVILLSLGNAFESISSTTFLFERLELNPNFATITRPGDAIILLKVKISIENRTASADVLIPYKTIEPIKEQLQQMFFGDKYGNDAAWEEMIFNAVHRIDLPIEAAITSKPTALHEIVNLKVGDTIVIDHEQNDDILIRSGPVRLFKARVGRVEDKIAVSITNSIED